MAYKFGAVVHQPPQMCCYKNKRPPLELFHKLSTLSTEPLFKSLEILPLPSLISYFKIQFMQQYKWGLLPVFFNNIWVTREAHRAQSTPMVLRNDADFYIPVLRLNQCSLLLYYSLPLYLE